MLEERIQRLIEKRTLEATKKELSKKLQTIVKAFGKPIIEQVVSYSTLPDFWETEAPDILESGDDSIHMHGYYFDSLSWGINITIKLIIHDTHMSELCVHYNGYQVYWESEGELKSYAPFESWENALERLYNYAKPMAEKKTQEEKIKQKETDKKRAMSIMQKLRLLWGY